MSGRDMVGIAQTGSGKTLAVSMLSLLHNQFLLFQFRDHHTLVSDGFSVEFLKFPSPFATPALGNAICS